MPTAEKRVSDIELREILLVVSLPHPTLYVDTVSRIDADMYWQAPLVSFHATGFTGYSEQLTDKRL